MAQFRKAVITRKGLDLLQKTQIQNNKLEFIRITTGAGEYNEDEEVENYVELKEPKQEFPISSITATDEKTIKLVSLLSNEDLHIPYYIKEIGVWANDPDEGEILYSLIIAYPDKAWLLPEYDGIPVTINFDIYQSVSDSANVTIRVDPGAYASAEDLNNTTENVEAILVALLNLDEIENQFKIVYFGGGNLPDTEDPEAMTSEEIEAAINTEWAGESSDDETAMSAEDVETSINTIWAGESSDDETAMSAEDVENATKIN